MTANRLHISHPRVRRAVLSDIDNLWKELIDNPSPVTPVISTLARIVAWQTAAIAPEVLAEQWEAAHGDLCPIHRLDFLRAYERLVFDRLWIEHLNAKSVQHPHNVEMACECFLSHLARKSTQQHTATMRVCESFFMDSAIIPADLRRGRLPLFENHVCTIALSCMPGCDSGYNKQVGPDVVMFGAPDPRGSRKERRTLLYAHVSATSTPLAFTRIKSRLILSLRSILTSLELVAHWATAGNSHPRADPTKAIQRQAKAKLAVLQRLVALSLESKGDKNTLAMRIHNAARFLAEADQQRSTVVAFVLTCFAIESLTCGSKDNVATQVAENAVTILQPTTDKRVDGIRAVKRLYDRRSRIAHGDISTCDRPTAERARLLAAALLKACTLRDMLSYGISGTSEKVADFLLDVNRARIKGVAVDGIPAGECLALCVPSAELDD